MQNIDLDTLSPKEAILALAGALADTAKIAEERKQPLSPDGLHYVASVLTRLAEKLDTTNN